MPLVDDARDAAATSGRLDGAWRALFSGRLARTIHWAFSLEERLVAAAGRRSFFNEFSGEIVRMNEINEVVEGTEGNEQKEAKKEVDGLEIGQAEPSVQIQQEGEKTEERVRAEDGGGRVDIEGVLRAIEEALPEFLRQSRAKAARREHPAGEAFFRGDAEEMTDGEAEEVARKQLERSGLLRGQRVRVGD